MYLRDIHLDLSKFHSPRDKAKRLFFSYAGTVSGMDHDGVGDRFREYGITDAEQREWEREFIAFWVSRLSVDDVTPIDRLGEAHATEALPAIMGMASQGDDYAKLWYANIIWRLARDLIGQSSQKEVSLEAGEMALSLWQSLVSEDIKNTEEHRAKIQTTLDPFKGSPLALKSHVGHDGIPAVITAETPEEYVILYARHRLHEADKDSPYSLQARWQDHERLMARRVSRKDDPAG